MAALSNFFKYLFNAESDSNVVVQRNALALAHFEGLSNTFEQMQAQISDEWGQQEKGSNPENSERAKVFYALATARIQLAQQLHAAFLEDQKELTANSSSQARLDLENLMAQIEVLVRATLAELAQPHSTERQWETRYGLQEAVNPVPTPGQGEDTISHVHAIYGGGLVLYNNLQAQYNALVQTTEVGKLTTARVLLSEAQHNFDMLRPLVTQLKSNPNLFATPHSLMHAELERQVESMELLLEGVAAELAVPGVTQTAFWYSLIGDPHQAEVTQRGYSAVGVDEVVEQPWKSDIWCMTSNLFKRDHYQEKHANQVLASMWQHDPDPTQTWQLYQEVMKLEEQGLVRPQEIYYNACPWTNIWHAVKVVWVSNTQVQAGQDFCLHIEAEPNSEFSRKVIVANFQPTNEIDYCDND